MDNDTLKDYLANNSQVITIFMDKATDFLNRQNEDRAPARRYNDAEIARQADKMLDDVIANIHDKIVPHTREQTPAAWEQFLSENDVLDDLELSMTELSFESEDQIHTKYLKTKNGLPKFSLRQSILIGLSALTLASKLF